MRIVGNKRLWLVIATVDALLLLGAGSALAAPLNGAAVSFLHLPTVLLAGVGLLAMNLSPWRRDGEARVRRGRAGGHAMASPMQADHADGLLQAGDD